MIAVDTNILIYAHRSAVAEHRAARRAIEQAAERGWGVASASLAELFSVATHPGAAGRPSTADEVRDYVAALVETADMQVWSPGVGFGRRLLQVAADLSVVGVRVFDLQIAMTAADNGAVELWTHDSRFVRFPGLRVRDPLAV